MRPLHHHLLNMRVFLEYFLDNVNSFWILSEEVFAGLLQIKLVDMMNEMFSEARDLSNLRTSSSKLSLGGVGISFQL